MQQGREIDIQIAHEVFGFEVFESNQLLIERTENAERPLKHYSEKMEAAWSVAEKMRISLVAIEGGQWFAFAASNDGWESPDAFLEYLKAGQFDLCGAAVSSNPALSICQAALVAIQKLNLKAESERHPTIPESSSIN